MGIPQVVMIALMASNITIGLVNMASREPTNITSGQT